MRLWKPGGFAEPRTRMWNWTFWAAIVAFEALGLFLSGQA